MTSETMYQDNKCRMYERMLDNICGNMRKSLDTQEEMDLHRKDGAFPFIPMHMSRIFSVFYYLREFLNRRAGRNNYPHEPLFNQFDTKKVRFLDAGCGIGNILLLANHFGLGNKFVGLEYFDKTADAAEMFLGLKAPKSWSRSEYEIRRRDITKYKHYGQYDFIYYFHPLSDNKKEGEFERRVEDQMKVGAILIAMLKGDGRIRKDDRFKPIPLNCEAPVWEKIKE